MTETELESFHPRHHVMVVEGDSTTAWASFVRGKEGVTRVTINDANQVRIVREGRPTLRVVMSDGYVVEAAPIPAQKAKR